MSGTNSDFNILCGQVSADNLDILDKTCKEMKKLGFAFTMVDLLVSVQPPDLQPQERDVLFHDDDGVIVLKSEKQRSEIVRVIEDNGLSIAACHFLQTLQPIGEKPGWIFEIHERLLDAAASAGAGTITTHFAWMFGEGNVELMGDFVARLNRGQISRDEFMEEKKERCGGREKVWQDSLEIYAHLCSEAASRSTRLHLISTAPVSSHRYEIGPDGEREEIIVDCPPDAIYHIECCEPAHSWTAFDIKGNCTGETTVMIPFGAGMIVVLGYDLSSAGSVLVRRAWRQRMLKVFSMASVDLPAYWTGPPAVQLIYYGCMAALINYNTNPVNGSVCCNGGTTGEDITLDPLSVTYVDLP